MFNPPPFNPEQPCELLAENTFEALRIVRQGDWVFKFLRPLEGTLQPETRKRELRLRAQASQVHSELNAMWLNETCNCVVSRFVGGVAATDEEASILMDHFSRSGRNYLQDISGSNVRIADGRAVVIDFAFVEGNYDAYTFLHS
jgi:hypothetical protein